MPNMVDERVVSMQFDNAQFEQAVAQSMETLQNLNNSLKLENGAKGFLNLGKAVETVSFEKIQNGIEALQQRFSLWGEISHNAVMRVADAFENRLSSVVKQFTVDPISDGWGEYELKMGSVQTIMASTGEELSTVNKYLQELNTYSDKTIYSFSDMTASIGKFTNAGVKLDAAVAAIKGISNEAARSGANAGEASRAMYNFSQALSSGSVKLIDWKSIENANMATVEFKKQLLETAVVLGKAQKTSDGMYKVITKNANGSTMKEAISATKGFNDSLSYQWMTADVLTETLQQYSANVEEMTKTEVDNYEKKLRGMGYTAEQIKQIEQLGIDANKAATEVKTFSMMMDALKEAAGSGWATTMELVFGDYEQAKELWTNINNVLSGIIDTASDVRNEWLRGGLGKNIYWDQWDQVKQLGLTKDQMSDLKKKIIELADAEQGEGTVAQAMARHHDSFRASLHDGWLSLDTLNKAMEETGIIARDSNGELTEASKGAHDLMESIAGVKDSGRDFALEGLGNVFTSLANAIKAVGAGFNDTFRAIDAWNLRHYLFLFREFTAQFMITEDSAKPIREGVAGILKPFAALLKLGGKLAKLALPVLGTVLVTGINLAIKALDALGTVIGYIADNFEFIGSVIYDNFIGPLYNGIKSTIIPAWESFMGFVEHIKGLFGQAKESAEPLTDGISKAGGAMEKLGGAMKPVTHGVERLQETVEKIELAWFTEKAQELLGIFKEIGEGLKNFVGQFVNFEGATEAVTNAFDTFMDAIDAAFDPSKLTDFPTAVGESWQALKDFVKSVVESIDVTGGFYNILKSIDDVFQTVFGSIKGFVDANFDFKNSWEKLKTAVGGFTGSFVAAFRLISQGKFVDAFKILKTRFGTFMSSVRDSFVKNENIKGILESLQKILGKIVDIAVELVGVQLPGFLKSIADQAKGLWESFDGASVLNSILEFFNGLLEKIQNGGVIDYLVDHLLKLGEAINNLFGTNGLQVGGATGGQSIFGKVAVALGLSEAEEGEEQVGILQKFSEKLQKAMEKFNEVFGKYVPKDAGGVMKLVSIFGALRLLFNAGTFLKKLGKAADIGANLSEMFKQFGGAAKAYKKNMASGTFKNIAIGIALIVGSLAVLTLLNVDRLKAAVWAIVPVLAVIGAVYIAAKYLSSKGEEAADAANPLKEFLDGLLPALKKMATAIAFAAVAVGFGVALLLIAKAIATFTEMFTGENASKYMTGVKVVAIIAVALMAFAAIISKLGSGLQGVGSAFMGLATSLLIMRWVFDLYKTIDTSAARTVALVAIAMGAIIAGLMYVQSQTKGSLDGVGKTFLAMASSLAILAFCMGALAKLPWQSLVAAAVVMAGMAVVITLVLLALSNYASNDAGTRAAKSFAKVASALKGLAIVAAILGFIPLPKIAQGFIAILAPLVLITGALLLLGNCAGDLEKVTKTIIATAAALLIMAAAMVALGYVNPDKLIQGGIALGGIAVGLVLLVGALEALDGSKAIKTLAVVAGVMAGLALVVVLLGSLPTGMIVQGLIALILPLIAIVAALVVLSHFSAQIALLGTAFLEFGVALLAAAAGVYLFAIALPKLVDGIAYVGMAIFNGIKSVIMAIYNSREQIGAAIRGFVPTLLHILWTVVDAVFGGLIDALSAIDWKLVLTTVLKFLLSIALGIIHKINEFGTWLGDSLSLLMGRAGVVVKTAVAGVIKGVINYIATKLGDIPILGDWIKSHAEGINDGLDEWVKNSQEGLDDLERAYDDKYKEINETVSDGTAITKKQFETARDTNKAILGEMKDSLNEKVSMTGFNGMPAEANAALRQMKTNIQTETPEIVASTDNLVSGVNNSASGLDLSGLGASINGDMLNGMLNTDAFSGVGTDNIQAFLGGLKSGMSSDQISSLANSLGINLDQGAIDGIQSKLPDLQNTAQQMGVDTVDFAALGFGVQSPSWKFEEIGMYCVEGLKNGFNSGISGLTGFMMVFSTSVMGTFGRMPSLMTKKMNSGMTGMVKAIKGKSGAVRSAANSVATGAVSAVNKWQSFYNMGQHCVNGMISGIRSKISEARRAAEDLGDAVTAGTRSTTKVASPSRVFMEIGRFVVAGLAIGIAKNAYQAASAAEDMGDSTIDAVANALSTLGRMAEEDINYTPTITPVVDLSSARLGFSSLNSMGSDLQLSLDGAINSKWDELNAMYDRLNGMTVGTDNSDVVSAINSLKADNAALRESIANMKVMLNRRIVGQIDNGLGQQQLLANRGV